MHDEQRQRTRDLLKGQGIDRALFAHPESVTWLTGFAPFTEMGTNPFAAGPALVWYEGGHFTLIVSETQAEAANVYEDVSDGTLISYEGYAVDHAIRAVEAMNAALRNVLSESRGRGVVGVEIDSVSAGQIYTVDTLLNNPQIGSIDGWLKPLRMVKTAEEIVKLRRSFDLADVGYSVAQAMAKPGAREIDVWGATDSAIQAEAGRRIPVGNDCVVGYRQNNIGGQPLDFALRPGDSLIVDLSAVHQGYWSDGCRTFYATEPTADQIKRHRFIQDALDYAISLIKPGVRAKDVDMQVRAFMERGGYPVYPHHTGHSVGVAGHEEPRIVPYNDTILEAGMVILLEPGTYIYGETGCRLEDGLLITADGVENLSHTSRELPV